MGLSAGEGRNVTAKPDFPTTYYATINAPNGCVRTDSIYIAVDSLPVNLDIMPSDTSVCEGSLLVLTSEIFEPSDFEDIEFQWGGGNGFISGDSLFNMVLNPDTTSRYFRVATLGVCTDTSFADVEVKPIPQIQIMPMDTTVCAGSPVQITTTYDPGIDEVMWMPMEGLSCTDCENPIATAIQTTTFTVQGTLNDCPGSASMTINVDPLPLIQVVPDQGICVGSTDAIRLNEAPAEPNTTYEWSSPDDPNFTSNDPALAVTPTATTTYILTATNDCGTSADQVTITLVEDATVSLDGPTEVCKGEDVTIMANGTAPAGVQETYVWRVNGETVNENSETLTLADLQGNVQVELSYTYGPNCGTIITTINIQAFNNPEIDVITDQVICAGDNNPILLNTAAPLDDVEYTWTSPDDPSFISSDPALTVMPTVSTTYNLEASNICGTLTESVSIFVVEESTVSIDGPTEICRGDDITFNAMGTAPANVQQVFEWLINGQPTDQTGPSFNLSNLQSSVTVSVNYTYGPNCGTATASADVQVFDAPEITFVPIPDTVFNGETVTLTAQVLPAIDGYTYQWEGEDILGSADGPSVEVRPSIDGEIPEEETFFYTLTVTTPTGCTATATIGVFIYNPTPKIPNVFTPNGDDVNDEFKAYFPGTGIQIVEFKVFNRWGQVVHNVSDNTPWDGEHNNKPAPSDVYVFKIIYELPSGIRKEEKGDVTLAR